jgi:hypothetical protein
MRYQWQTPKTTHAQSALDASLKRTNVALLISVQDDKEAWRPMLPPAIVHASLAALWCLNFQSTRMIPAMAVSIHEMSAPPSKFRGSIFH